jgi:hypothetical protein
MKKNGFLSVMAAVVLLTFAAMFLAGCDNGSTSSNGGKTLVSIAVTTQPTKTQYNLGEELDTAGMVVTAAYSDNSTAAVTGYTTSGYDKTKTGNQTVTVTYQGKTAVFSVNVIDPNKETAATPTANPAAGAAASGTMVSLNSDTTDAEIWYTVNGGIPAQGGAGSTKYTAPFAITPPVTVKAVAVKDGMNDSAVLEAAYTVLGEATLTGITITTQPTKTQYAVGDAALDLDGLEVTANYSNNTTQEIGIDALDVSGFDSSTAGSKTITVTYGGKSAYFTVMINPAGKTLNYIYVWPMKNYYVSGEAIDVTTLSVMAYYSDSTSDAVSIGAENISGFDSSTAGEKTVTVSYGGKTATFTVTVRMIESIVITSPPAQFAYAIGETLDLTGLVIRVTYTTGSTEQLSNINGLSISGFDSSTAGSKTITVTYGGKSAAFTVIVNPAGSAMLTSVAEVAAYLNAQTGGTSVDDPVTLPMQINLGTLSQNGSGFQQLLNAIQTAGKYVDLNLSACIMTGTDFSPDSMFGGGNNTGKNRIVSIVLPNTAASIGAAENAHQAFSGFENLKTFSGGNITVIGNSAFSYLPNLAMTELPAGLITIDRGAFSGCTSLALTTLPAGLTSIESGTFYGCTSLAITELPAGITSVGEEAFMNCTGLTSMKFPASLDITGNVFAGCSSLVSFTLTGSGDLKTAEGGKALANGTELITYPSATGSVSLSAGLTSIGDYAFYQNTNLTQITLPSGVTAIGYSAFYGNTNLTQVTLPSGVTSIGNWAFYECANLTLTELPTELVTIGEGAFSRCTSLALTALPAGITSIGQYAFINCANLALTELPAGITSILHSAFQGCTSLTLTELPAGLTSINGSTFNGCTGLTQITLPAGITSIENNGFSYCENLTQVTLPAGFTSIGDDGFRLCTSLALVTCLAVTPPELSYTAFTSTHSDLVIKVPAGSVAAYKAANRWSVYADKIEAIE